MKKVINTENAPKAIGPYSQGVIKNSMLFISGQLPIDAKDGKIVDGIQEQTKKSLENIVEILKAANASVDDVVKCTVFLKDMDEFSLMNKEYEKIFTTNEPARAAVEVARLPKDVLVEIEAIAII